MNRKNKSIVITTASLTTLVVGLMVSSFMLSGASQAPKPKLDSKTLREMSEVKKFMKKKDWSSAVELLAQTAVGSNAQAKYEYAMLFTKGWGVPRDLERARNLLLQAVKHPFQDRTNAALELGKLYRISKGEDCARIAFEWFNKAVEWGNTKAHNDLGKAYARGIGVTQDVDQALNHYRIAAANNSSSAVLLLIELLAKGDKELRPDPKKALAVLNEFLPRIEIAAKAGDARAARSIARLYTNNSIMEPNHREAFRWFSMASSLGDAIAMHDMALLIIETKKGFAVKEDVINLLHASAERDYPAAITTLGRLHLNSQFGLPELGAVDLFKRGVLAGHAGSMEELSRLYLVGHLVHHDLVKARKLAEKGNRLGHAGSHELLKKIERIEASRKADSGQNLQDKRG